MQTATKIVNFCNSCIRLELFKDAIYELRKEEGGHKGARTGIYYLIPFHDPSQGWVYNPVLMFTSIAIMT